MNRRRQNVVGLAQPGTLPGPIHLRPRSGSVGLALSRIRLPKWDRERVSDLDRPTVPPPQGRRGDDPADIALVVDDSGSTAGTDSHGYRYVALRRIVNLLADGIG